MREILSQLRAHPTKPDARHQALDRRLHLSAVHMILGRDAHVVVDRKLRIDTGNLHLDAQPLASASPRRPDRFRRHQNDPAAGNALESHDQLEDGALPGAVWPDQAAQLAALDDQMQIRNGQQSTEALRDSLESEQRGSRAVGAGSATLAHPRRVGRDRTRRSSPVHRAHAEHPAVDRAEQRGHETFRHEQHRQQRHDPKITSAYSGAEEASDCDSCRGSSTRSWRR